MSPLVAAGEEVLEKILMNRAVILTSIVFALLVLVLLIYLYKRLHRLLLRRWDPPEWESLAELLTYSNRTLKKMLTRYTQNEPVANLCLNLLQIRNTEKLVKKTRWLVYATWFLAVATAMTTIFHSEIKKWLGF